MQKKINIRVLIIFITAIIFSCDVNRKNTQTPHQKSGQDLCLWQSVSHTGKGKSIQSHNQLTLCGGDKKEPKSSALILFPQKLKVFNDEQGVVKLAFTLSPSLLKKKKYISKHTEKESWRLHYQLKVEKEQGGYPLIKDQADYKELKEEFAVFLPYEQLSRIAQQEKKEQLSILFKIWQEAGEKKSEKHQEGRFTIQLDHADLAKYLGRESLNKVLDKQKDSPSAEKSNSPQKENIEEEAQEQTKEEENKITKNKEQPKEETRESVEKQAASKDEKSQKGRQQKPSASQKKPKLEEQPQPASSGVEKDTPQDLSESSQNPNLEEQPRTAIEDIEKDAQQEPANNEEQGAKEKETSKELEEKKPAINESEEDLAAQQQKKADRKDAKKAEKLQRRARRKEAKKWLDDRTRTVDETFKEIQKYKKNAVKSERPYQSYMKINEEKINSLNQDDKLGIAALHESLHRTRSLLVNEYKELDKKLRASSDIYKDMNDKEAYLSHKKVAKLRNKVLEMDKIVKAERQEIVKKVRHLNKQMHKLEKLKDGNLIQIKNNS